MLNLIIRHWQQILIIVFLCIPTLIWIWAIMFMMLVSMWRDVNR